MVREGTLIKDYPVLCKRYGCDGSIYASVLAHKLSTGLRPECRLCKALPNGGQCRRFQMLAGRELDPLKYERSPNLRAIRGVQPFRKSAPNNAPRKPNNVKGPILPLQARLDKLELQNAELLKRLQQGGEPAAEVCEPDEEATVDDLKALQHALEKAGITAPPELDSKIQAANTAAQKKVDPSNELKVLSGQINKAEAHVKQCANSFVANETKYNESKSKSQAAANELSKFKELRDEALRKWDGSGLMRPHQLQHPRHFCYSLRPRW